MSMSSAEPQVGEAVRMINRQLSADAIKARDAAISIDPSQPLAYYYRGLANQEMGNLTAAVIDYIKAIELSPKDAGAYLSRGTVRAILGDPHAALADYSKAIELDPRKTPAYLVRGH